MIDVVIIGRNEWSSIKSMLDSLKKYSYSRIWVLDRCTDDSEMILSGLGENFIKTSDKIVGRQTSHARNLGLSFTDNDVLFLDGDRFIKSGDLTDLENSNFDIELLFLENDIRDTQSYLYGDVINGVYSCGMLIKRSAINKIAEFQDGKLFNEDIQDVWGIEDTYLGDVCFHLGLTCNYNKSIRLNGNFTKTELECISALGKRFELRDKLNVNW